MNQIAFLTTVFPMNIAYLEEMLDSLLKQSDKEFDLVVVNDSLDEFSVLVKDYADDLNVIELQGESSPAKNRQIGINYCIKKGYDFLVFGDSDDTFSANRISQSVALLQNFDVVVNDLTLFDEEGILEDKYISNRLNNNTKIEFDFIKNKNIFGLSNTAIKLKGLDSVELPIDLIAVDWYLFSTLLLQDKKALFTNEAITYYRQYAGNLVGLKYIDNESYARGLKIKKLHYQSFKTITDKLDLEYEYYCQNNKSLKAQRDLAYPLWWELI